MVIANGQFKEINTINDIVNGQKIGTFFTYAERDIIPIEDQAIKGLFFNKKISLYGDCKFVKFIIFIYFLYTFEEMLVWLHQTI